MDVEVFLLVFIRDLVVSDLEHTWYFKCGRCSIPLYLVTMNFSIPWQIWLNGVGSLSVCMICSLSVVTYLGSRENASMPIILWGRWARMLKESLGMLHMDFVSLMRSSSGFLMSRTKKGRHKGFDALGV